MAEQLRVACEETGFLSIVGHQISPSDVDETFAQIRKFHKLPIEKKDIQMERPVGRWVEWVTYRLKTESYLRETPAT